MMMRVASPEREMLAAAMRVASKQYEIDANWPAPTSVRAGGLPLSFLVELLWS
jgi:hypothetical protein